MAGILLTLVTVGSFLISCRLVREMDEQLKVVEREKRNKIFFVLMICYLVAVSFKSGQGKLCPGILAGYFWSSLAVAAYCDYCTNEIYDFIYLPAIAGGILGLSYIRADAETVAEVLLFCLLQCFLFRRFYGGADCITFSICALYMGMTGRGFLEYMLLMSGTFLLLAVVQGMKRNINKKGNLKKPVALIPYIAAVMLFMQ